MIRLELLKLLEHPQLGNINLNFLDKSDTQKNKIPYSTVIIGPNGTGKSYILSTIINLFRELYEIKKDGKRKKHVIGKYILKYQFNEKEYCYRNMPDAVEDQKTLNFSNGKVPGGKQWREKPFFIEINGKPIKHEEIELPEAILASSFMLTDKYVFLSKPEEFPNYNYLGIRATKSTAGTRSYIKKSIDAIANANDLVLFKKNLPEVLTFLGLEKYLFLSYVVNRKHDFFSGNITIDSFKEFYSNYGIKLGQRRTEENKEITAWYGYSHYRKIADNNDLIASIVNFCKRESHKLVKNESRGNYYFEYDLLSKIENFKEDYIVIYHLDKLNLIQSPGLCFKKENSSPYNFESASSGESHFLTSIIGILAAIKENSIILFDEPEISLHPNWQMKYMNFIRELFKTYANCHFIIATHSHFLISDLKGENSKIIGLNRINDKIVNVDLSENLNTYGWPAEDVLFRVFKVKSVRNHYFEMAVADLLNLLYSKSKDFKRMNEILNELKGIKLSENDPLNELIEETEDYIRHDKSN